MYRVDEDYVLPVKSKEDEVKHMSKKKLVLIVAVIIAVVITGIIVGSFFFPKSITGDWELIVNPEVAQATADEIQDSDRAYYSFSKPNKYGDGTYKTFYNGGVEEGAYKLSQIDGKDLINLGTEDLEYKITGSKLLGNAKLVITYPEYTNEETGQEFPAEDYVFTQQKAPQYEKENYNKNGFHVDDNLLGEWITNERTLTYYVYDLSYTQTVEFFNNGIMTIHYESADLALDRYMYYAYTASDGELTFSLVTDKETQYSVSYKLDESGNLVFVEDSTADSIFADAFFSDVTYYTPDNFTEFSVATADEVVLG